MAQTRENQEEGMQLGPGPACHQPLLQEGSGPFKLKLGVQNRPLLGGDRGAPAKLIRFGLSSGRYASSLGKYREASL